MSIDWDLLAEKREALRHNTALLREGLPWCHAYTDLVDGAILAIVQQVSAQHDPSAQVAIVATGGYGRRELSPYSDIDLAIVPRNENHPALDELIRHLHRELYDSIRLQFGVSLGYAFLLSTDATVLDDISTTGWIDSRFLAGDLERFTKFNQAIEQSPVPGEFLLAKLQERQQAFAQLHDTPLVVEPHLKDGAGGLRCFQTSNWIRWTLKQPALPPTPDFQSVLGARNLLHTVAGKPQDVLTRQRQSEIADLVQEDVFAFMSAVSASMCALNRQFEESVQLIQESDFLFSPQCAVSQGVLSISPTAELSEAAQSAALASKIGLRVKPSPIDGNAIGSGPSILHAIGQGESAIRHLDKASVLQAALPEIVACRNLFPRDSVHTYTVFEHSVRVVRNLELSREHPFLRTLWDGFAATAPLMLAALLHDVGKQDSSKPHSESGAEITERICQRWRLSPGETNLIVWLVREHLSLDKILRFRDVHDPATSQALAELVQSKERLAALCLLTWADVNAVSADSWTASHDHLLQELYLRTLPIIEPSEAGNEPPTVVRTRLMRELEQLPVDPEAVSAFLSCLSAAYVVSTAPEIIRLHMEYVIRARAGQPTIEFHPLRNLGQTEICVCCADQKGLLSKILGVLYALDIRVHDIRVNTAQFGDSAFAVDQIRVSFARAELPDAVGRRLASSLLNVIQGSASVDEILRSHGKDPDRQQEQFEFILIPGAPAILEIRAPNGRGLGYRMSRWIAQQGWNIVSARIGSWAGRGAAAFSIVHPTGEEITEDEVNRSLPSMV